MLHSFKSERYVTLLSTITPVHLSSLLSLPGCYHLFNLSCVFSRFRDDWDEENVTFLSYNFVREIMMKSYLISFISRELNCHDNKLSY